MTSRLIAPISGVLVWLCCALPGYPQIKGKILDDASGVPVAGATVIAAEAPKAFSPTGPTIQRATSQSDGTYSFDGLPLGSYHLCVHHPGDYLDPCQWPQGSLKSVSPGGPPVDIRLQKGARLCVRVYDPEDLASQVSKSGPVPLVPVNALITADAAVLRPLLPVQTGERQYEYCSLAPPDTDFTLTVSSAAFLLADNDGTAIDEKGWSTQLRLVLPVEKAPSDGRPIVRPPFAPTGPPARVIVVKLRGVAGGVR
ncbi:MAG: carboxypeptidase regulatory-like domain-containing protein [Bryobacteraceae bacterium]|nr:carboxypeptidase regulatory-like domain-containing protein [Bryobacteraceae bacterium]